mmetsp:Transcript_2192/g.6600  ORF Transcript_2192/g.6600 Transcript_2192/m.6600 type:complete len:412 (+) Transcript_2192:1-1236(+)
MRSAGWRAARSVLLIFATARASLRTRVLAEEGADPHCGRTVVVESADGAVRFLGCNGTSVGAAFGPSTGAEHQLVYTGMVVQAAVAYLHPHAPRRALCLGLGAGAVPTALRERHGVRVDVIEISPSIVRFAADFFFYDAQPQHGLGSTIVGDALDVLGLHGGHGTSPSPPSLRPPYDVIVADVFDGGLSNEHQSSLLHRSVLELVRERWLTPDTGCLVLNVVGPPPTFASASAVARATRALRATFRHVRAFGDSPPLTPGKGLPPWAPSWPVEVGEAPAWLGNVILFASNADLVFKLPSAIFAAAAAEPHEGAQLGEAGLLVTFARGDWEFELDSSPGAEALTGGHQSAHDSDPHSAGGSPDQACMSEASPTTEELGAARDFDRAVHAAMHALQAETHPQGVLDAMSNPSR